LVVPFEPTVLSTFDCAGWTPFSWLLIPVHSVVCVYQFGRYPIAAFVIPAGWRFQFVNNAAFLRQYLRLHSVAAAANGARRS